MEPSEGQFIIKDKTTYLYFATGNAGTYVVGIPILLRILEMDAKAFIAYLVHKGLKHAIAKRKALKN